jgi:hypothetical protein
MKKPLLDVDPKGFARVQGDKPKGRMLAELFQNAKDEDGVTEISIDLWPVGGKPTSTFKVEDNSPEGFSDLTHAYTLFAPSYKLDHPEKSGWMNLGEKMVIVGTKWCRISSTKGEVYFDMADATREEFPRRKREKGTVVEGELAMTREEHNDALLFLDMLISPPGIKFSICGKEVPARNLQGEFRAKLPTRILRDGMPAPSIRETAVRVWEVKEGEEAHIYELGIPVVSFAPKDGMTFHVDVGQKVPLNKDRDNVTPAFKSLLLAEVLNNLHEQIVTKENVTSNWVVEAASQKEATKEATEHVLDEAFGKNRVIASVTDPEANNKAMANGYTVIPSRGMTPGMRENAKGFGLLNVSHDLFRTPKPFSDDPNAPPVEIVPESEWTDDMKGVAEYAKFLGQELLGRKVLVVIAKELGEGSTAAYGPGGTLYFSLKKLGRAWFRRVDELRLDDLLVHEFGHEYAGNHLSEDYYTALTKLAAKMKQFGRNFPTKFEELCCK